MASDEFLFHGVKPKCVQGSWLSVRVDQRLHALQLMQYTSPSSLRAISWKIPLPQNLTERILGKPVCIGCRDHLYILQYVTERCKYLRFMLVNLNTKNVQLFEDGEKYFNRDFASVGPVECMINPALTQALLRLPQAILSSRKWSKMLSTKITMVEDQAAHCNAHYKIENLRCESLRDRKNQAVSFDPRYAGRVAHVLVNSYCSKCNIMLYDLNYRKTVAEQDHRLASREIYKQSHTDMENYFFLTQCNADYCRSGEIFILCCVVQSSRDSQAFVRLYMFNADSLHLIRFIEYSAQEMELKVSEDRRQLLTAITSPCDQWLQLWALEKGRPPRPLRAKTRLPKAITLQALCRAVIIHECKPDSLSQLQLPPKLQAYVQFKPLNLT